MGSRRISFGIGFVTGLRSMTACAALSWATALGRTRTAWIPASPNARAIATTMAMGEMAGDKMPFAPDRRIPPSLAVRLVIGAVGGAAMAGTDSPPANGALIGLAGAIAGTLLGRRARGANTRSAAGWARGLTEDVVAIGLAMTLIHHAEQQGRPWQEERVASDADAARSSVLDEMADFGRTEQISRSTPGAAA